VEPAALLAFVGKERVMTSGVIGLLVEEQVAEQTARLRGELAECDQKLRDLHYRAIEDILIVRFPTVPLTVKRPLHKITQLAQLETLRATVLAAPDEAHAIAAIAAAAAAA
jgi:hypothetical protein